jgi:hypothetical protein
LTGGIRKGAKGEPPVAHFFAVLRTRCSQARRAPFESFSVNSMQGPLIFFFSSADFLAYDTIPEEIYLFG